MKSSDYKAQANLAKQLLENVSPTFCLAKWNQVSLHLPTGLTNSCYHPPLHKIDATKLEDNIDLLTSRLDPKLGKILLKFVH